MGVTDRAEHWAPAEETVFDVTIVGGGVTGACLYHQLCQRGLRVLLIDKGDFASGTDLPPGTSPLSKLDLGPFEVHSMV